MLKSRLGSSSGYRHTDGAGWQAANWTSGVYPLLTKKSAWISARQLYTAFTLISKTNRRENIDRHKACPRCRCVKKGIFLWKVTLFVNKHMSSVPLPSSLLTNIRKTICGYNMAPVPKMSLCVKKKKTCPKMDICG